MHMCGGAAALHLFWLACCDTELKTSGSWGACGALGCTCLALGQLVFFSEKIMAFCLSLGTRTFIRVLVCFFPYERKE